MSMPLIHTPLDWHVRDSPTRLEPGRAFFDLSQPANNGEANARIMAGIDWTYYVLLAATLAIAGCAICVMLFAM
jgi:hypothetical protein